MATLLVLPSSLLFLLAGASKFHSARTFRFVLLELGLTKVATTTTVKVLALIEMLAGILGLVVFRWGLLSVAPMFVALLIFTAVLLWKRPRSCGCGSFDLHWSGAAFRNVVLLSLLATTAYT